MTEPQNNTKIDKNRSLKSTLDYLRGLIKLTILHGRMNDLEIRADPNKFGNDLKFIGYFSRDSIYKLKKSSDTEFPECFSDVWNHPTMSLPEMINSFVFATMSNIRIDNGLKGTFGKYCFSNFLREGPLFNDSKYIDYEECFRLSFGLYYLSGTGRDLKTDLKPFIENEEFEQAAECFANVRDEFLGQFRAKSRFFFNNPGPKYIDNEEYFFERMVLQLVLYDRLSINSDEGSDSGYEYNKLISLVNYFDSNPGYENEMKELDKLFEKLPDYLHDFRKNKIKVKQMYFKVIAIEMINAGIIDKLLEMVDKMQSKLFKENIDSRRDFSKKLKNLRNCQRQRNSIEFIHSRYLRKTSQNLITSLDHSKKLFLTPDCLIDSIVRIILGTNNICYIQFKNMKKPYAEFQKVLKILTQPQLDKLKPRLRYIMFDDFILGKFIEFKPLIAKKTCDAYANIRPEETSTYLIKTCFRKEKIPESKIDKLDSEWALGFLNA